MKTELYLDTGLLRQHATDLQNARRKAQLLQEQLRQASAILETKGSSGLRAAVTNAGNLAEYYRKLSDALEGLCDDCEQLVARGGRALDENTAKTNAMLSRWEFNN